MTLPRRWIVAGALLLATVLGAPLSAQTRPATQPAATRPAPAAMTVGRVTVAAYNVEWMTDVFDDPYTHDETQPPKPQGQLEQIAKAIRAVNPDVISFEELENEGLLRAFVGEMLADMGYKYVAAQPTNSDRGQNLGIISRLPIVSITSHRFLDLTLDNDNAPGGATWQFARDLMQVKLQVTPTRTLDVFVVHLKSKHDSPEDPKSAKWRLAEATAAKRIIDRMLKAEPEAWIILQGDINDTPASKTVAKLLEAEANQRPDLADLHSALPAKERITYQPPRYRHEGPIDYILASPALAKRAVPGSAKVLADEKILGGSDHAPVVVSFDVKD